MSTRKRICVFLLVLAALAPVTAVGIGQYQVEAPLRADGGAPPPPPIPVPWLRADGGAPEPPPIPVPWPWLA